MPARRSAISARYATCLQTIQDSSAAGGTVFTDCAMGYCGTFAKSITCTIDTTIQNFSNGGRWSCTFVDGY